MRILNKLAHGCVQLAGCRFGVLTGLGELPAEEWVSLSDPVPDEPELFAEPPQSDHPPGQMRRALQIAFGAGGGLVEDDFLCRTTPEQDVELGHQVHPRVVTAIVLGGLE